MTPTLIPPPTMAAIPSASERCDRCNAGAKLRVVLAEGSDLLFCGHHANRYADELVKIAVDFAAAPDFDWKGAALLPAN